MKKCCSWLPEAVAFAGVAIGVGIGVGVAYHGWPVWPEAEGQTWAAWVQAVGSVVAILAAVWVARDQNRTAERRHQQALDAELRNFLAGVRDELTVLWALYMTQAGNVVASTKDGETVNFWWPPPEDPFTIWRSGVDKIGRLQNDALRQSLITVYALANGLLLTFKAHNELLHAGIAAHRKAEETQTPFDEGLRDIAVEEWLNYDNQLRTQQEVVQAQVNSTVELLDAELARSGGGH
ncbi:hypothetical protein [Achromobacter xylosoxidans]|uniref:hypothetical protein n=1 Tax=Alcaligenes xylosoxydans xylosoxydans TaxID=85698 RepID=UPI001EEA80E6|nr:hypothetical protein [Achromobacter xylosoxidans]